jgi:hypothetical protein
MYCFFSIFFSLLLNVLDDDDDVGMKTSDLYSSIDLVNIHKEYLLFSQNYLNNSVSFDFIFDIYMNIKVLK